VALTTDTRKTLYLTTAGTSVGLDHDAFKVRRPDTELVRTPVRAVDSIICVSNVTVSTAAMARCADEKIPVSWLATSGRFRFGLRSPTHGNVLLRMEQYRSATDAQRCLDIARVIVIAKLLNSRVVLLDAAKDRGDRSETLRSAAQSLADHARQAETVTDLDSLRGVEGAGAKRYFSQWSSSLISGGLRFTGRVRRPPLDPVNALLSFGYTLLQTRCVAAAEHVGLDPHIGFLHSIRPGRPSLALDLMEEFRAPVVDRLVLTLINRRQFNERDFQTDPVGGCRMTETARAAFLAAYDSHLTGLVSHRALAQKVERRKLPDIQALLLARHLRGDLLHYLPYRAAGR
jgi:CRISPR-associated protein Cas1